MAKRARATLATDFDVVLGTKRQHADYFLLKHAGVISVGVARRSIPRAGKIPVILFGVLPGRGRRNRMPIPATLPAYDLRGRPLPNRYVATAVIEHGLPVQDACSDFPNGTNVTQVRPIVPGFSTGISFKSAGGMTSALSPGTVGAKLDDAQLIPVKLRLAGPGSKLVFAPKEPFGEGVTVEVPVPIVASKPDEFFFLTCAHVVVPLEAGAVDLIVLQSGQGDGQPGQVGGLERYVTYPPSQVAMLTPEKQLELNTTQRSLLVLDVDAAVVKLDPTLFPPPVRMMPIISAIQAIGRPRYRFARKFTATSLDLEVQKSGRTTGLTTAIIDAVDCDHLVARSLPGMGGLFAPRDDGFLYRGQLMFKSAKTFACGGDSGALILDTGRNAVALLCAADTTNGKIAFGTPIDRVLAALNDPTQCVLVNNRKRFFMLSTR